MEISLISVLLQVLPESFGLLLAGFTVAELPIDWRRIVIVSVIHSVTVYFVRQMPVVFGLHTVIFIVVLTVYILIVFRLTFLQAPYVAQLGMMLLMALEASAVMIYMQIFKFNFNIILADPFLRSLFAAPHELALFALAFFQNRKNIKKWKEQREEEERSKKLLEIMDREIEEMKKGFSFKKKY